MNELKPVKYDITIIGLHEIKPIIDNIFTSKENLLIEKVNEIIKIVNLQSELLTKILTR